jgi:hypothetical protein
MKQSKISFLVFGLVTSLLFLFQSAPALTFLTEQFSGYADGRLGDAGIGGGGSIPGWNTPQNSITVTNSKGSLSGTSLGLVASLGTRVSIATNNVNNGAYNKFVNSGTFPTGTATNIYTSFLYRINDAATVSATGTLISGMNRQNSGFGFPVNNFSWYLMAQRVGNNIQLGLTRPGGTGGASGFGVTNYATTNLTAGQTFFVVVRQQIIPPATTPDEIDLWINPDPTLFGTNEVNVPSPAATTTDGTDDTSNTGPGRLWVISSGVDADIDEMRVANTWAEATPPTSQCISAGIASSPSSVTQVEGINATFKVVATGTGPTYQWQISTNGGSTWNNISGAVLSTYTTPNLYRPNDNGNQYRAVVSVACDASSAISAAATVTLTSAVATPIGVLMDDFFGDPNGNGFNSRQDTPLTSSNSLWYTWRANESGESDSGLTAIGNPGYMTGTPAAGSSSLWLGYFVSNTTVVSLDIGKAIKVTMPFNPTGFASHTNNGALRFGLFDYFDSGTNVTADASDLTGSGGRGTGVRGYMLSVDFGTVFTANSPLSLLVRNGISDPNLMGTTGDYTSLGSGPSGGGYSNAPAFQAGTDYTLEFTVARTGLNSANITATITGGGTNWTFTATDTNFAYYRFDTFAIRPNSLETAADSFNFPEFKVEVVQSSITVNPFNITDIQLLSPGSVKLSWASQNGVTYQVLSKDSLAAPAWVTNATVTATGPSTSYTNSTAVSSKFYRILATP